jgi:hypothetical protein
LEELDNFNNVRFLRKHYKDPITGQDFKLLHFGEVRTMFGGGVAGIPGAVAAANMGNVPGAVNPQAAMIAQGGLNQVSPLSQNEMNTAAQGQARIPVTQQGTVNQLGDNSTDSNSISPSPSPEQSNSSSNDQGAGAQGSGGPLAVSAFGTPGQQFGGGPIVGVASTSKKKSIREFNKKDHYKDWQFIYDPSSDRGGLLNTPAQPNLNASMNAGQGNNQAGPGQAQGVSPQQQGGFGQQPGGFGQQPNSQQGMPMPNQPPDQMQPPEQ